MPIAIRPVDILRILRHGPTRLENFVDAAFAFAVTVLVIPPILFLFLLLFLVIP